MGPIWGRQGSGEPMLAPWTLLAGRWLTRSIPTPWIFTRGHSSNCVAWIIQDRLGQCHGWWFAASFVARTSAAIIMMTSSNGNIFRVTGPFLRGIHRSPVNSPHKGQWRRALMFSLICVWINVWVNNCEAGDLRRFNAHYDITVMYRLYSIRQIGPILPCGILYIHCHFSVKECRYIYISFFFKIVQLVND